MPTLSEQILDQMNIEVLTQELQNRSKARNAARRQSQAEPSSLASSVVDLVHEQDRRSDVESAVSHTSTSFDEVNASSSMSHSALQSWVESSGSRSPAPSIADSSAASSTSEVHLSESIISASGNSENHSVNDSGLVCFLNFSSRISDC
jgi:peroxin-3